MQREDAGCRGDSGELQGQSPLEEHAEKDCDFAIAAFIQACAPKESCEEACEASAWNGHSEVVVQKAGEENGFPKVRTTKAELSARSSWAGGPLKLGLLEWGEAYTIRLSLRGGAGRATFCPAPNLSTPQPENFRQLLHFKLEVSRTQMHVNSSALIK
ncbi:MAG: hypothetical protein WA826_07505 [Silvibacterium sp.]